MNKTITAKEVQSLLMGVYLRFKNKEITETTANKETYILNSILKTIEITDLEDRLRRVEDLLNT